MDFAHAPYCLLQFPGLQNAPRRVHGFGSCEPRPAEAAAPGIGAAQRGSSDLDGGTHQEGRLARDKGPRF